MSKFVGFSDDELLDLERALGLLIRQAREQDEHITRETAIRLLVELVSYLTEKEAYEL